MNKKRKRKSKIRLVFIIWKKNLTEIQQKSNKSFNLKVMNSKVFLIKSNDSSNIKIQG